MCARWTDVGVGSWGGWKQDIVFVTISCISGALVVNKGKGWKYQDRCVSSTLVVEVVGPI